MKKIYYLQEHEVKLGDIIEYNGIKAIVTNDLIEFYPELFSIEEDSSMNLWAYIPSIKKEPFKLDTQPMYFKSLKGIKPFTTGRVYKQVDSIGYPTTINLIADDNKEWTVRNWQSNYLHLNNNCFELTTKAEWNKQELLDKAKRDYPVGTIIKTKYGIHKVLENKPFVCPREDSIIQIKTDRFSHGTNIYSTKNGWAEILPLKFTTEDGVGIYGDMKTYAVAKGDLDIDNSEIYGGTSPCFKYFYHKENALAYIEKLKEKTLKDYEDILLNDKNLILIDDTAAFKGYFYKYLKEGEPKLYYTKILQLIADDLNDGWVADFSNYEDKWFIKGGGSDWVTQHNYGAVPFKTRELSKKARVILGNKVKYLSN